MAYTVKFEDGTSVNFDAPPSPADIEEVHAKIRKPAPTAMDQLGSGISAAGRTALGVVGAVPQALAGIGSLAMGADPARAMDDAKWANPAQWLPEGNDLTKKYQDNVGEVFDRFTEGTGRAMAGDTRAKIEQLQQRAAKGDKKATELLKAVLAEENASRLEGEILGNLLPIGIGAKAARGKGKPVIEPTKSKLDAVDAEMNRAAVDPNLELYKQHALKLQEEARNRVGGLLEDKVTPQRDAAMVEDLRNRLSEQGLLPTERTGLERDTPLPIIGENVMNSMESILKPNELPTGQTTGRLSDVPTHPVPGMEGFGRRGVVPEQPMGELPRSFPPLDMSIPVSAAGEAARGRTNLPQVRGHGVRGQIPEVPMNLPEPVQIALSRAAQERMAPGNLEPGQAGNIPRTPDPLSSRPAPREALDVGTSPGATGFEPNRPATSVGAGLVEALKRQREEGAGGFPFKDRISHLTDDPAAQMMLRELDQRLSEARRGIEGASARARELEAQLANHGFDANHPWTTGEKNVPPVQHSTARNGLSVFDKSNKALPIEKSGTRDTRLTPDVGKPFDPKRNSMGRFSGLGKKQRGQIHPDLQTFGVMGLLDKVKGMSDGASRVLSRFVGTFNKEQLVIAKKKSLDPRGTERLVWMRPATFHALAMARDLSRPLLKGMAEEKRTEIRKGLKTEAGLDSIPELGVRIDERGVAKVEAHEGRHRMDVFAENKLDRIPVLIKSIDKKLRNADPLPAIEQEYGNTQYQAGYIKDVFPQDPANAAQRYPGSENGPIMMGNGVPLPDFLQKGLDRVGKAAASAFEKNASLQSAVKGMPAAISSVYDGITQQGTNAAEVLAKNADFNKDITNKARIAGQTVISGANIMAKVEKNPFIRSAYEMFDQSNKLALKDIDALVHPAMTIAKDMSKQEKMDVVALMMKYEGKQRVSPEVMQKAGYGEKEVAFYKALTEAQDVALTKINEARAAIGKEPLAAREGFMASTFRGAFKTIVRDKNGKPVYVISENTRRGHDSLVKEFQTKFGKDFKFETFDPKNYEKFRNQEHQADFFYKRFMQDVLKDDPRALAMDDLFREWKAKQAEFELGHNQHAKAKSETAVGGAEGLRFEKDAWQNAQDYMEAQLRYIENSFVWSEHQKAYKSAGELIEGIKERLPNTADYIGAYRDQAIGARRNAIGRLAENIANETNPYMVQQASSWAKATLNGLLLGGPTNMAFMVTQLLQTINALPEMVSVASRLNKSQIKALAFDAPLAYTKVIGNLANHAYTKNDPAINWAFDNHVMKGSRWEDIGELHEGKAVKAFGKVWNGGIRITDLGGRGITYLAFVNLFKKHFKGEELYRMAADATERTMTDYRGFETPMAFESGGFIGQTAGFLHKYPANWVNQLVGFAKTKEFAPLVALLGTSFFTAGVTGLIGINTYEAMANIFGWPSLKEYLFKSGAPTWLTMGPLSAVSGVDFQAKTSMADIIPDNALDVILPGAGFVTNVAKTAMRPDATWQSVAHAATPASLKGVSENLLFSKTRPDGNVQTFNPNTQDAEYVRTPNEALARVFAFRSTKESVEKQQKYIDNQRKQREFTQEDAILTQFKSELHSSNPFVVRNATDKLVAEWKKKGLNQQGLEGKITRAYNEANIPEATRNLMKGENAPENFIKSQRIRHGE